MSVALVMTVYNSEKYLAKAIDSVIAQDYLNWQLVIWDDGSTDSSLEIAHSYYDHRILVVSASHHGRPYALKTAIKFTTFPYIGFVDSDDLLAPNALSETVKTLDLDPSIGLVYTNYCDINAEGVQTGLGSRCLIPYSPNRLLVDFMIFHFRLFRREIYDSVGGISLDFLQAQDYDLCLKISEVTKIYHLPIVLYYYRKHLNSISSQQKADQILKSADAVKKAITRRKVPYELYICDKGRWFLNPLKSQH